MDVSDLRDGLLRHPPRTRPDPIPAGGFPVRRDRDRDRDTDRRLVAHPSVAETHDREAPRWLRAYAPRLPLLRTLLPGELPRIHRRCLHAGAVPRDARGSACAAPGPPARSDDRHAATPSSRIAARAFAAARARASPGAGGARRVG